MDDTQLKTAIKSDLSWLQRHERMVICALVLMVAMFLGNKWLDSSAAKAQAQASVAAQLASDAKLSAQQAATQAAQTQAQYQAMVDMYAKQNAVLATAITNRDAILGKQQTAVQTAPLTDVAQQWQIAIGGQGDITSGTTGLNISSDGSRRTLSMLLEVPVLKSDLDDELAVGKNTQFELDDANKAIAANSTLITTLNAEIKADDAQCKADVKAVKATANKSKVKWFKIGFVTGFVSGLWAGHAVGL